MLSDNQKKTIYHIVLGLGISLLMLIVILVPCMTEVKHIKDASLISLMVMIPFLSSVVCFVGLKWFVSYTTKSALAALDRQFHNNKVDIEMYKKIYKHIVMFDLEKKKLEHDTQTEKEKIEIETRQQAKKKLNS